MKKTYFIYRYVDSRTSEILYIGKTERNLKLRILEHESESKFVSYLPYTKIQYYRLNSHVQMDIHEKYWIHTLQPKLNVVDKYENESDIPMDVRIHHVHWLDYDVMSPLWETTREPTWESILQPETIAPDPQEELDKQYINAEQFLEYSLEQYIQETAETSDSKLGFLWDLTSHPLPTAIPMDDKNATQWLTCYIQAIRQPNGEYLSWNTESNMRQLWKHGATAIAAKRREITESRL